MGHDAVALMTAAGQAARTEPHCCHIRPAAQVISRSNKAFITKMLKDVHSGNDSARYKAMLDGACGAGAACLLLGVAGAHWGGIICGGALSSVELLGFAAYP